MPARRFVHGSNTTRSLTARAGFVVLVLVVPFFFVGSISAEPLRRYFSVAHIVYFAVLGVVLLRTWPWLGRQRFAAQIGSMALLAAAAGGAIELAQELTRRSPTVDDVFYDIVGGVTAIAFFSPARFSWRGPLRRALQMLVLAVTLFALVPAVTFTIDAWYARARLPVLADFETPFQRHRVNRGEVLAAPAPAAGQALRVLLTTARYSGVQLYPVVRNWRDHDALGMRVYVEGREPLPMTVSIVDRSHYRRGGPYHDRYNRVFALKAGWNDIRIALDDVARAPRDRDMDMDRIAVLNLFAVQIASPRYIYVDDVRLLPAPATVP